MASHPVLLLVTLTLFTTRCLVLGQVSVSAETTTASTATVASILSDEVFQPEKEIVFAPVSFQKLKEEAVTLRATDVTDEVEVTTTAAIVSDIRRPVPVPDVSPASPVTTLTPVIVSSSGSNESESRESGREEDRILTGIPDTTAGRVGEENVTEMIVTTSAAANATPAPTAANASAVSASSSTSTAAPQEPEFPADSAVAFSGRSEDSEAGSLSFGLPSPSASAFDRPDSRQLFSPSAGNLGPEASPALTPAESPAVKIAGKEGEVNNNNNDGHLSGGEMRQDPVLKGKETEESEMVATDDDRSAVKPVAEIPTSGNSSSREDDSVSPESNARNVGKQESHSSNGSFSSVTSDFAGNKQSEVSGVTVPSSSSIASRTATGETAVPVINADSTAGTRGGRSDSITPAATKSAGEEDDDAVLAAGRDEPSIENESANSAVRMEDGGEEGMLANRQEKKIRTGIPDSKDVISSGVGITITASVPPPSQPWTTSSSPATTPSHPPAHVAAVDTSVLAFDAVSGRNDPADSPLTSGTDRGFPTSAPSADQTGNNLSSSDNVAPQSPDLVQPSFASPVDASIAGAHDAGTHVNHQSDDDLSARDGNQMPGGKPMSEMSTDLTLTPLFPAIEATTSGAKNEEPEPQPVLSTEANGTSNSADSGLPVAVPANDTAFPDPRNMTDEAKCNHSTSSSHRYTVSGFRLSTFEAFIAIFIVVFVVCAVLIMLFVFTIFRRKGNHTFDFQASRNQTPTVFQMRGKFLQENRMLRGYDLNSDEHILKDEESHFPLNHLNPRVQHLDSYHHYLHPSHHPHYVGVRRGSSGSSPSPIHGKQKKGKYSGSDPHACSAGISLKPIYLPRPVVTSNSTAAATAPSSHSPAHDSGRLVSQSLYPYNLARLSPSERNRVFYQKRIPGGANILVNEAWMVLPLDPIRRSSCCSASVRDDRCDGCRRHSCPIDPMTTTIDRGSASSRGSRDSSSICNNNNRHESNLNQILNLNNNQQQHHLTNHDLRSASPDRKKKSNNHSGHSKIYNNEMEKAAAVLTKSSVVNDVTDTKL